MPPSSARYSLHFFFDETILKTKIFSQFSRHQIIRYHMIFLT